MSAKRRRGNEAAVAARGRGPGRASAASNVQYNDEPRAARGRARSNRSSHATTTQQLDTSQADGETEDMNTLYCFCRTYYDADDPMLACDKCNNWYHNRCVNIDAADAKNIEFICLPCRNNMSLEQYIQLNNPSGVVGVGLGKSGFGNQPGNRATQQTNPQLAQSKTLGQGQEGFGNVSVGDDEAGFNAGNRGSVSGNANMNMNPSMGMGMNNMNQMGMNAMNMGMGMNTINPMNNIGMNNNMNQMGMNNMNMGMNNMGMNNMNMNNMGMNQMGMNNMNQMGMNNMGMNNMNNVPSQAMSNMANVNSNMNMGATTNNLGNIGMAGVSNTMNNMDMSSMNTTNNMGSNTMSMGGTSFGMNSNVGMGNMNVASGSNLPQSTASIASVAQKTLQQHEIRSTQAILPLAEVVAIGAPGNRIRLARPRATNPVSVPAGSTDFVATYTLSVADVEHLLCPSESDDGIFSSEAESSDDEDEDLDSQSLLGLSSTLGSSSTSSSSATASGLGSTSSTIGLNSSHDDAFPQASRGEEEDRDRDLGRNRDRDVSALNPSGSSSGLGSTSRPSRHERIEKDGGRESTRYRESGREGRDIESSRRSTHKGSDIMASTGSGLGSGIGSSSTLASSGVDMEGKGRLKGRGASLSTTRSISSHDTRGGKMTSSKGRPRKPLFISPHDDFYMSDEVVYIPGNGLKGGTTIVEDLDPIMGVSNYHIRSETTCDDDITSLYRRSRAKMRACLSTLKGFLTILADAEEATDIHPEFLKSLLELFAKKPVEDQNKDKEKEKEKDEKSENSTKNGEKSDQTATLGSVEKRGDTTTTASKENFDPKVGNKDRSEMKSSDNFFANVARPLMENIYSLHKQAKLQLHKKLLLARESQKVAKSKKLQNEKESATDENSSDVFGHSPVCSDKCDNPCLLHISMKDAKRTFEAFNTDVLMAQALGKEMGKIQGDYMEYLLQLFDIDRPKFGGITQSLELLRTLLLLDETAFSQMNGDFWPDDLKISSTSSANSILDLNKMEFKTDAKSKPKVTEKNVEKPIISTDIPSPPQSSSTTPPSMSDKETSGADLSSDSYNSTSTSSVLEASTGDPNTERTLPDSVPENSSSSSSPSTTQKERGRGGPKRRLKSPLDLARPLRSLSAIHCELAALACVDFVEIIHEVEIPSGTIDLLYCKHLTEQKLRAENALIQLQRTNSLLLAGKSFARRLSLFQSLVSHPPQASESSMFRGLLSTTPASIVFALPKRDSLTSTQSASKAQSLYTYRGLANGERSGSLVSPPSIFTFGTKTGKSTSVFSPVPEADDQEASMDREGDNDDENISPSTSSITRVIAKRHAKVASLVEEEKSVSISTSSLTGLLPDVDFAYPVERILDGAESEGLRDRLWADVFTCAGCEGFVPSSAITEHAYNCRLFNPKSISANGGRGSRDAGLGEGITSGWRVPSGVNVGQILAEASGVSSIISATTGAGTGVGSVTMGAPGLCLGLGLAAPSGAGSISSIGGAKERDSTPLTICGFPYELSSNKLKQNIDKERDEDDVKGKEHTFAYCHLSRDRCSEHLFWDVFLEAQISTLQYLHTFRVRSLESEIVVINERLKSRVQHEIDVYDSLVSLPMIIEPLAPASVSTSASTPTSILSLSSSAKLQSHMSLVPSLADITRASTSTSVSSYTPGAINEFSAVFYRDSTQARLTELRQELEFLDKNMVQSLTLDSLPSAPEDNISALSTSFIKNQFLRSLVRTRVQETIKTNGSLSGITLNDGTLLSLTTPRQSEEDQTVLGLIQEARQVDAELEAVRERKDKLVWRSLENHRAGWAWLAISPAQKVQLMEERQRQAEEQLELEKERQGRQEQEHEHRVLQQYHLQQEMEQQQQQQQQQEHEQQQLQIEFEKLVQQLRAQLQLQQIAQGDTLSAADASQQQQALDTVLASETASEDTNTHLQLLLAQMQATNPQQTQFSSQETTNAGNFDGFTERTSTATSIDTTNTVSNAGFPDHISDAGSAVSQPQSQTIDGEDFRLMLSALEHESLGSVDPNTVVNLVLQTLFPGNDFLNSPYIHLMEILEVAFKDHTNGEPLNSFLATLANKSDGLSVLNGQIQNFILTHGLSSALNTEGLELLATIAKKTKLNVYRFLASLIPSDTNMALLAVKYDELEAQPNLQAQTQDGHEDVTSPRSGAAIPGVDASTDVVAETMPMRHLGSTLLDTEGQSFGNSTSLTGSSSIGTTSAGNGAGLSENGGVFGTGSASLSNLGELRSGPTSGQTQSMTNTMEGDGTLGESSTNNLLAQTHALSANNSMGMNTMNINGHNSIGTSSGINDGNITGLNVANISGNHMVDSTSTLQNIPLTHHQDGGEGQNALSTAAHTQQQNQGQGDGKPGLAGENNSTEDGVLTEAQFRVVLYQLKSNNIISEDNIQELMALYNVNAALAIQQVETLFENAHSQSQNNVQAQVQAQEHEKQMLLQLLENLMTQPLVSQNYTMSDLVNFIHQAFQAGKSLNELVDNLQSNELLLDQDKIIFIKIAQALYHIQMM